MDRDEEQSDESKKRLIDSIWSFGGKSRIFLTPEELENLPEISNARLSEEDQEIITLLREGFNTLSDMQKRVLLLMVDQKMSIRRVADTLGLHFITVANHLKRARKKLREYVIQNADLPNISERYDR